MDLHKLKWKMNYRVLKVKSFFCLLYFICRKDHYIKTGDDFYYHLKRSSFEEYIRTSAEEAYRDEFGPWPEEAPIPEEEGSEPDPDLIRAFSAMELLPHAITVGDTFYSTQEVKEYREHTVLSLQKPACGPAVGIQCFRRNDVLMCRNLEDAVAGGVDNQVAGQHMCFAEAFDALRSGIRAVAENAASGDALKRLQNLFGEAVGIGGEGMCGDQPRNFPVSDRRILACGLLHTASVCCTRCLYRTEEGQPFYVAVTERAHGIGVEMGV